MSKAQKDYKLAIERVLEEFGVNGYHYESGGKHMRCYYTLPDGRKRHITFPTTGSDHRGAMNTARDARRELRSQGLEPKDKP